MENVNPFRPQWMIDAEHTLTCILQFVSCLLLIKGRLQGLPSFDMHPRASDVLFSSMIVYGLACGIYTVSRGRVHVAAYWVAAVSAFLMLTSLTYVTYA